MLMVLFDIQVDSFLRRCVTQIFLRIKVLNELTVSFTPVRKKRKFLRSFYFHMFVERMEVLEYCQKFEVELSTFPDSINTETPRKLFFSLTCVCVSVCGCEKVCQ